MDLNQWLAVIATRGRINNTNFLKIIKREKQLPSIAGHITTEKECVCYPCSILYEFLHFHH